MKIPIVLRVAFISLASVTLLFRELRADPGKDPDFGPNVMVFSPTDDAATIQSKCDAVFQKQESNQFGNDRNAIFFKPGTYPVKVKIGFYTQVYGLGKFPDDTTLTGGFHCDAKWMGGNGTCNFWRGCENIALGDGSSNLMWAVSQAVPLRRVHIKGKLTLFQPDGNPNWTSGGFMADCQVDGTIVPGSQQQWLSRNSSWQGWSNGVWNMVFVGCPSAPAGNWPDKPYTAVEKTPVISEKPFLFIDQDGGYKVFVPGQRKDSVGCSWENNEAVGTTLPLASFYIARSDKDTADTINAALAKGQNLLLTPGVYKLDDSLKITRADTVVLGIGMPTLSPVKGTGALEIADVNGVKIACVLLDAGPVNSPYLMQVGETGSKASHANDPTIIYDIFARVGGGSELGVATSAVIINSNDVIGDQAWLWRADHGNMVGWSSNKSTNGLIVNGNNVTYYGLFVEHYQQDITQWNGENGRTYFYQCELPYDPPTQNDWTHTWNGQKVNGWPGYKVADNVKTHEAWGLGVYAFFTNNGILCDHAFEVPKTPGVKIHNACIVGFKAESGIVSVIDGVGDGTIGSNKGKTPKVEEFPTQ